MYQGSLEGSVFQSVRGSLDNKPSSPWTRLTWDRLDLLCSFNFSSLGREYNEETQHNDGGRVECGDRSISKCRGLIVLLSSHADVVFSQLKADPRSIFIDHRRDVGVSSYRDFPPLPFRRDPFESRITPHT